MGSHLRSVIDWARGSKIGGVPSERSMDVLNSHSPDTNVGVDGSSEEQQISFVEPSSPSQEHGRNEAISTNNCPSTLLNSDPDSTSGGTDSQLQTDLTRPATKTTSAGFCDVRNNIKNDLLSGKVEIPPFNKTVLAKSKVIYQFPAALLDQDYVSKYKKRFDRSELLPGRDMPLSHRIMGYAQSWGMWIAEMPDEEEATRERLLDRVFEMAQKAWFEALKIGYTPDETQSEAPRAPKKRPAIRGEELPPRLRGWVKPKRDLSPSQLPFLIANHKSGPAWAITVGELEEAGISESRILQRAVDEDSLAEEGEDLLNEMLELYSSQIAVSDWLETVPSTKLNPMGRDLQIYCLFEVLKSRESIHLLQGYYAKHSTTKQKEATQKRIDEEQERHNLFMALALEVEEDNPEESTPAITSSRDTEEGSLASAGVTTKAEPTPLHQLESLVDAAERIISETDVPYMISTAELYEISEADTATGPSMEEVSNNSARCKQTMREILLCARQLVSFSKNAESLMDVDTNIDKQNLQMQIDQKKEILKVHLPMLVAERDAAKSIVEALDMNTDVQEEDACVPPGDNTQTAETSDLALPIALPTTAKRPFDEEETDEGKVSTPPTKKQKVIEQDKDLQGKVYENSSMPTAVGVPDVKPTTLNRSPAPIILRIPPKYDLDQWSSETVSHQQGFSYRYARESSLSQRFSMTDTLLRYIREKVAQPNNDRPFGKYQGLCLPFDPEPRETIIHGVWNLQNGERPAGFERFYSGKGDYQDEVDASLVSDTEGEDDELVQPPKRARVVEPAKTRAPADSSCLRLPKAQLAANLESKEGNRSKQESSHSTGIDARTARASSRHVQKDRHEGTPMITNYGSMGKRKPTKLRVTMRQTQMPQTPPYYDTISSARPRRHAVRKNYDEGFEAKGDDGDEDFEPDE